MAQASTVVFVVVIFGLISATLLGMFGITAIFQELRNGATSKASRCLSILLLTSSWLTCIGNALFRTNLLLPLGDTINCHYGYYLSSQSIFVSKMLLFCIFLHRIQHVFHSKPSMTR